MFQIGDTVMYGNYGVCRISDIRKEKFGNKERLYYVLKPEDNNCSTIYYPVDSDQNKFRRLLSREEILELIKIMPETEPEWIEDDQQRQEKFLSVLKEGNHQELVKLIKTLYAHRAVRQERGKRLHIADKKIMQEAEALLYSEFAYVLKIEKENVIPFIVGELGGEEV